MIITTPCDRHIISLLLLSPRKGDYWHGLPLLLAYHAECYNKTITIVLVKAFLRVFAILNLIMRHHIPTFI